MSHYCGRNDLKRSKLVRLLRFEVLERRMCLTALGFDSSLGGMEFTDTTDNSLIPALVETNHAITTDAGVQQSPSIAVDPNDPTHLVVAYMDYSLVASGYAGIGISISRDSGRSWERDSLKLPSDFDQGASDPIVKFDAQSHVYVSFMAATFKGTNRPPILNPASGSPRSLGFEANNGIFVALSDDGGSTWQAPIAVASQRFESSEQVSFDINPDMAIDTLPRLPDGQLNPNFGNIYVTWARYYPSGQFPGEVNSTGGSQFFIAASSDGGQNWHLRTQQPSNSDGTFLPQIIEKLPNILFLAVVALGDLDKNGTLDLVAGGGINDGIDVFRGLGDGSFVFTKRYSGSRQAASLAIADLNGDGNLDVVATSLDSDNAVTVLPGNGHLGFDPPMVYEDVGQGPLVVRVADWGSQVSHADNEPVTLGPPDGVPDLIVANSGVIPGPFTAIGPPGIVLLPGLLDKHGIRSGFGDPFTLSAAEQPLDLELTDFDGDGSLDIAVVDRTGFFVIFGNLPAIQSNASQATARDLGTVVHIVQPTLTILPGHEDAWFRIQVASEASVGASDQVLDFSSGFAQVTGAGLRMAIVDAVGNLRAEGDRIRLVAKQAETLFIHISGLRERLGSHGAGAYQLVIDTLPQLVAIEAPSLIPGKNGLPGGAITSLVLVLQGDRLDQASAENAENYRVTWLGPDGRLGTSDDQDFKLAANTGLAQSAVYNASGNRDVARGRTYPVAIRQTVTLLFSQALPAGSYQIEVSPRVQAASFNLDEVSLLTPRNGFSAHAVVSHDAGQVHEGARILADRLVVTSQAASDFQEYTAGTRFLTQLHADLGTLLDSALSENGDVLERDTLRLLENIAARITPALSTAYGRSISLLVILLDPVSISLLDPEGNRFAYDLRQNNLSNNLSETYVQVGGNVELLVIAQPRGAYDLTISDVPPLARGGYAYFGSQRTEIQSLTSQIRVDQARSFSIPFGGLAASAPTTGAAPPISSPGIPTIFSTAMLGQVSRTMLGSGTSDILYGSGSGAAAAEKLGEVLGASNAAPKVRSPLQRLSQQLLGLWLQFAEFQKRVRNSLRLLTADVLVDKLQSSIRPEIQLWVPWLSLSQTFHFSDSSLAPGDRRTPRIEATKPLQRATTEVAEDPQLDSRQLLSSPEMNSEVPLESGASARSLDTSEETFAPAVPASAN